MVKQRFTSGPWKFSYGAVYTADEKVRLLLADRDCEQTSPTERDANCRLAASAPDLLAACEVMLAVLRDMTTEKFSLGADKSGRELMAAAIRKAKGA